MRKNIARKEILEDISSLGCNMATQRCRVSGVEADRQEEQSFLPQWESC